MMFKAFVLSLCATAVVANNPEAVKRQDSGTATATGAQSTPAPTTSINYSQVQSLLNGYLSGMSLEPMVPKPTVTLGLSIPESLKTQIYTAVPATVLVQLMNTEYRASVASDFAAGATPAWYTSMSPELQSFFESMAGAIQTGQAIFTRTTTTEASQTVEEDVTTETSSDFAKPTGADSRLMAGVVGMAGVLGVALAL